MQNSRQVGDMYHKWYSRAMWGSETLINERQQHPAENGTRCAHPDDAVRLRINVDRWLGENDCVMRKATKQASGITRGGVLRGLGVRGGTTRYLTVFSRAVPQLISVS